MNALQPFIEAILGKRKLAQLWNLYIGSRHNRKESIYHRWDCDFGGMIRYRGQLFKSQSQAIKAGYRPCKVCQPDRHPYSNEEWVPNSGTISLSPAFLIFVVVRITLIESSCESLSTTATLLAPLTQPISVTRCRDWLTQGREA